MALQLPRTQGPSVDPSVAPTVRVRPSMDPSNFGGGRGVDQAAGVARGISGDWQDIALQKNAEDMQREYNELTILGERGEFDRKEALLKVKGKDARQAASESLADFQKFSRELEGKATHPRVKERLALALERNRMGYEAFSRSYAEKEVAEYDGKLYASKKEGILNTAAQGYEDPLLVALKLDELDMLIRDRGAATFAPKEWVKNEQAKAASDVHQSVVDQFLSSGNDRAAKAYFDQNKEGFLNQARVRGMVDQWSTLGEAQRTSDDLSKLPTLSQAREALKSRNLSPEIREKADSLLSREFGLKARAAEEFRDNEMAGAVNDIVKNFDAAKRAHNQSQILSTKPVTAELLVGPQRWDSMSGADRLKLQGLVDDLYKPEGIQTKANLFAKLHGMTQDQLASYSEQKFTSEFLVGLSKEDYNHAKKLWKDSKEQSPEAFRGGLKDRDTILDAMKGVGIGSLDKADTFLSVSENEKKSKSLHRFMGLMASEEASWKVRHDGKAPKPEEYKALAENLALREARSVTLKRYDLGMDFMDSDEKRRLFDLTPEELNTEEFDIPPELKTEFFNLARSKGGISQAVDEAGFESQYRGRLNRAFVAWVGKESDKRIKDILSGK